MIPLEQELAMVQDYVDIERARLGDKLHGRVEVPAELRDANVPPLSVQSLVENAVKHGISPQRDGGEVCVSASAENGQLRIAVSDYPERIASRLGDRLWFLDLANVTHFFAGDKLTYAVEKGKSTRWSTPHASKK